MRVHRSASTRHVPALLFVLMLPLAGVLAQPALPRVLVGPSLGVSWLADRTRLEVFPGSFDCGAFTTGQGLRFAGDANIILPGLFSDRFGLAFALGVDHLAGGCRTAPTEPTRIVDRRAGGLVELEREYLLEQQETAARLLVAAQGRIAERWQVKAGLLLRYVFRSRLAQNDVVVGPQGYGFSDGALEHVMPVGSALQLNRLAVEPVVALAHTIPLASGRSLCPEAGISYELSSPRGTAAWQRLGVGLRLALLFDLSPEPKSAQPVDEPPRNLAPSTPRVIAALRMSGLDAAGAPVALARIAVNEILARHIAPLLPAVFFEQDSTILPVRYMRLEGAAVAMFALNDLAETGLYDLQHRTLDVVGERLRTHPDARLLLHGTTSSDELGELGPRRAVHVREYLEKTWGIDTARITYGLGAGNLRPSTERTDDGRSDNRRVELASDHDALLAPVLTERVAREFNPPVIRLQPEAIADAGVRRWRMVIRQGERILARYEGEGRAGLEQSDFVWRIDEGMIDSAASAIVAELSIEDSTGGRATAHSEVPVTVERRMRTLDGRIHRNGGRERISIVLVGFNFDADRVAASDAQTLQELAALTRDGARITITGYTDRIGSTQRNQELSVARAAATALLLTEALRSRAVRNVEVDVVGGGVETSRFTNDTPEGRMLSRGVGIVVEQDAEGSMSQ